MFRAYFKAENKEPQQVHFSHSTEEPRVMEFKGEDKSTVKFKICENFKLDVEN